MMTMFFTFQFGISGYAIYGVPWLGWDLVEPVTYTVSQGTMIGGLYFMYRNRGHGTDYTQLDDFLKQARGKRYRDRYDFDLQRMYFVKERIDSIDQEIKLVEFQIFE